jgi:hypothetical protein
MNGRYLIEAKTFSIMGTDSFLEKTDSIDVVFNNFRNLIIKEADEIALYYKDKRSYIPVLLIRDNKVSGILAESAFQRMERNRHSYSESPRSNFFDSYHSIQSLLNILGYIRDVF